MDFLKNCRSRIKRWAGETRVFHAWAWAQSCCASTQACAWRAQPELAGLSSDLKLFGPQREGQGQASGAAKGLCE